jgi:hypothetical protein
MRPGWAWFSSALGLGAHAGAANSHGHSASASVATVSRYDAICGARRSGLVACQIMIKKAEARMAVAGRS